MRGGGRDEDAVQLAKGLLSAALDDMNINDVLDDDELDRDVEHAAYSSEPTHGYHAEPETLRQTVTRVAVEYSVTIGWIVMSVVSSVSIILANKEVFALGFRFPFTLTTAHFIVQALMLESFVLMGTLEKKHMPWRARAAVIALNVLSISLMNVSLNMNTVCIYQISKMMIIPLAAALQYYLKGTTVSKPIRNSLAIVLLGVAITNITEVDGSIGGAFVGLIAALVTAGQQTGLGYYAHAYDLSSPQILQCVSVSQVLVQGVVAYLVEEEGIFAPVDIESDRPTPGAFEFTSELYMFIILSCVLAVAVNVASTGLIKNTSSITYQVVGHAKTAFLLLAGYLFFPTGAAAIDTLKQLTGVCVTMAGIVWYGILKDQEKNAMNR